MYTLKKYVTDIRQEVKKVFKKSLMYWKNDYLGPNCSRDWMPYIKRFCSPFFRMWIISSWIHSCTAKIARLPFGIVTTSKGTDKETSFPHWVCTRHCHTSTGKCWVGLSSSNVKVSLFANISSTVHYPFQCQWRTLGILRPRSTWDIKVKCPLCVWIQGQSSPGCRTG